MIVVFGTGDRTLAVEAPSAAAGSDGAADLCRGIAAARALGALAEAAP